MEQTREKLNADLALLKSALNTLEEALREPKTDLARDATIQRFEYVFELSWKTISVAANYMGLSCQSPREAVKAAFKQGWIHDPEDWLEALDARNKTSHTYNEKLAKQVYEIAQKFPHLVRPLTDAMGRLA